MRATSNSAERSVLPANIVIGVRIIPKKMKLEYLGRQKFILPRNTPLPVDVSYLLNSKDVISPTIEIDLFYGDNELEDDNIPLGLFVLKDCPNVDFGGQVRAKVIVDQNRLLRMSILDPVANAYLNLGFVEFSKITPPPIQRLDNSGSLDLGGVINELIGDMVSRAKGGEPYSRNISGTPQRGDDILQNVELSFEDALSGTQKHIDVLRSEKCSVCFGQGYKPGTSPKQCTGCNGTGWEHRYKNGKRLTSSTCPRCDGSGQIVTDLCEVCGGKTWVQNPRPLTIRIPSGIESEGRICFPALGQAGKNGGPPGNLYVDVSVRRHELFTRFGYDITVQYPVCMDIAEFGGEVKIPNPEGVGYFILELPPKTKNGATFRVCDVDRYSLFVVIDTYNPKNPFAVLPIKGRLLAIEKLLKNRGT